VPGEGRDATAAHKQAPPPSQGQAHRNHNTGGKSALVARRAAARRGPAAARNRSADAIADDLARHAQTCGDAIVAKPVAKPLARQEHDLGPHDITMRRRILLGPSVQFGLLLLRQRGVARGTFKTSHYSLRFFLHHTLGQAWGLFGEKKIASPRQKRLPDARSDEQVRQLLSGIRNPVHKTCLAVMYACGLRISEVTTLEAGAVDRANQVLRIIGTCLPPRKRG
jgi:integrase